MGKTAPFGITIAYQQQGVQVVAATNGVYPQLLMEGLSSTGSSNFKQQPLGTGSIVETNMATLGLMKADFRTQPYEVWICLDVRIHQMQAGCFLTGTEDPCFVPISCAKLVRDKKHRDASCDENRTELTVNPLSKEPCTWMIVARNGCSASQYHKHP